MDDFMSPDFRPITHLMPYWGIFPFRMRFTDYHWVSWSFPLMGYSSRWLSIHYFYDDSSVEPLGSHPVRHALLGIQMSSYPSFREMPLGSLGMIQLWIWMTRITYLSMHDLVSFVFPDLSHIQLHTKAYFRSQSRFADSHFCMIALSYEIRVGLMIQFHSIMTLRWTYLWVASSGSHFPMLVWFLARVVSGSWILASSFRRSTYRIFYASPSSYSWVIRIDRVYLMPY